MVGVHTECRDLVCMYIRCLEIWSVYDPIQEHDIMRSRDRDLEIEIHHDSSTTNRTMVDTACVAVLA